MGKQTKPAVEKKSGLAALEEKVADLEAGLRAASQTAGEVIDGRVAAREPVAAEDESGGDDEANA